ncbi:MAG: DUF523 and DUF1722 domain-containing protein [Gammaproteobacteria bacterium]|nr:DUF523 and DUF1722 domain-containing protein [Gammaproteobacteria bacterium]
MMRSKPDLISEKVYVKPRHTRPLLGVSACLSGKPVRFDKGHKKNKYILNDLSRYMDFVEMCPELEAGFGVPRPAMQLRKQQDEIRLVFSKQPDVDITQQMTQYAENRLAQLADLDGFIFKSNSPSCGVFRVPVVVHKDGIRERTGTGIFAQLFQQNYPLIPVEEEGRLNDPALRENFFERVYAYRRWKGIESAGQNVQALIEFHAQHKFMLMARGSEYYQQLGRMVSGTTKKDLQHRRNAYIKRFMEVMQIVSKPGRQVNVLQHIMGYLKKTISSADKQELLSVFEAYRNKQTPLITPVTLLSHHLRINPQNYIVNQHYLNPYPEQLALRSTL